MKCERSRTYLRYILCPILVNLGTGCKTGVELSSSPYDTATVTTGESTPVGAIRDLSHFHCQSQDVRVAFFDADSTLRVTKSGSPAANSADDVLVLPFVAEKISELNKRGYLVAIVSNQGGIGLIKIKTPTGTRLLSADDVAGGLLKTANMIHAVGDLQGFNAHVDYIDMAEKKDVFRKPESGMAQMLNDTLQNNLRPDYSPRLAGGAFTIDPSCSGAKIDWAHSFMIGDAAYAHANSKTGATADSLPATVPRLPDFGTGGAPYPREADDFTNSDRLFAEQLKITSDSSSAALASVAMLPTPIAFQEPADFFGWQKFGAGNIIPDAAKDSDTGFNNIKLRDFLDKFSSEIIPELRKTDSDRADAIAREIDAIRKVNY